MSEELYLERAIAGSEKVAEAFHESLEASLAADKARRETDERLVAVLQMIVMRLDRIENALAKGQDNE